MTTTLPHISRRDTQAQQKAEIKRQRRRIRNMLNHDVGTVSDFAEAVRQLAVLEGMG